MKHASCLLILLLVLAGCNDGTKAATEADGRPLHIVCYSGGTLVVDDVSTKDANWGGYGVGYRSRTTNRMVKVHADCVVIDEAPPAGWKPLLPGRGR